VEDVVGKTREQRKVEVMSVEANKSIYERPRKMKIEHKKERKMEIVQVHVREEITKRCTSQKRLWPFGSLWPSIIWKILPNFLCRHFHVSRSIY
jgi:hypothetical protein